MTALQVASTILEQLGGNRFKAMTGAKNFIFGESESGTHLTFALPRAKNKINRVRITLTPADTYTVEFFSVRGLDFKTVSNHDDVYCDTLADVFESQTGLYVSL